MCSSLYCFVFCFSFITFYGSVSSITLSFNTIKKQKNNSFELLEEKVSGIMFKPDNATAGEITTMSIIYIPDALFNLVNFNDCH